MCENVAGKAEDQIEARLCKRDELIRRINVLKMQLVEANKVILELNKYFVRHIGLNQTYDRLGQEMNKYLNSNYLDQ